MPRSIDYFFTIPSPWTYLGHTLFLEICARHGVAVRCRPVPLLDVFDATGSLPLPKRPPARQRYRFVEMQRWRDKRGLPLVFKPNRTFDPDRLNRAIVAVGLGGGDAARLAGEALAALWRDDRDLSDEAEIAGVIARAGFEPRQVLEQAAGDEVAAAYARNKEDAIAADVFGAPAYVLDGEIFWGQDRLELLEDALASGRAPYRPL
jgi:2-hydroxychromene-2-carboxylate isomerase